MAEEGEEPPPPMNINVKAASTSARSSSSPLRYRPLARASTFAETSGSLRHRRSSNFSDSVDDAKQSIKSSTDDILLPRVRSPGLQDRYESSHWHSAPLALALFPAIGGLLFKNGSAVVTDVTLLSLAAIFLNWSVRMPWEWYHSAQSKKAQEFVAPRRSSLESTIIEEVSEEEQGPRDGSASFALEGTKDLKDANGLQPQQVHAATELHRHEFLALLACFICPLLGAWLLHAIRGQLLRPSEGLVSNFNLSLFLLASEIRPLAHLMKMIQARTLYLQRTVNADAHEENIDYAIISDLTKRLDELESYAADTSTVRSSPNTHPELGDQIKTEVRKSLQPDLDALNRAVRRYEKKMVALTMQTESRLQDLESRMSDAITLAAAAERSTALNSKRGSSAIVLFDWVSTALLLPLQAGWVVVSLPARLITATIGIFENYVGNKVRKEMRTAGRMGSGQARKGSRVPKKAM